MFEKWYALDAGAYQIRLYNFSNQKEISMRTCLAFHDKNLLAMCDEALEYVYYQKPGIKVKYPVHEGKITDDFSVLLEEGMKRLGNTNRFYRPCLYICLPERNDQVENEWIVRLSNTGIKKNEFVSNFELLGINKFHFFIHAGHSYTQIGFVCNGKIMQEKIILFAGQQMDEEIQKIVVQKTQCLISIEDARILKEAASKSLMKRQNAKLSCFAMNKYQKYVKIEISSMDLWPAMESVEKQIVLWTKECISKLGLEMQDRIMQKGITLSGGLANCFGLKPYLEHELHCPVICTEDSCYDILDRMKELR